MKKNNFNIIPTVSVSGIEFGTDRSTVRKLLGKPKKSFRKTISSVNTTDAYPSCYAYYSADNKLEAIEFFGNEISLSINSQVVFPGALSAARKILPDLEECYGSYVSKSASIGICIENDAVVSILAGCKNYYE